MTLVVGQRFADRFTVVRLIGEGGMGVVFEVTDGKFREAPRALKVLRPGKEGDEKQRALFTREVTATASIASEHVVQVIDYDTAAPTQWMLMELLTGERLDEHVEKQGALPWNDARQLLMELGHALKAAHHAKPEPVLHLDLKPSNLFLARAADARGTTKLKVLDFGLSRQILEGKSHVLQSQAMGTMAWMPPEQGNKKAKLHPSADVWPLGLIAFWMLTAKHYWESLDDQGEVEDVNHFYGELARGATVAASERARQRGVVQPLPDGFDGWFAQCVAQDPSVRFADGDVASRELDSVLARASVVSSPTPVPAPLAPVRDLTQEVQRPMTPAGFTAPVRVVMPQPVVAPPVQTTVAVTQPTPARSRTPLVAGAAGLAVAALLVAWRFGGGSGDGDAHTDGGAVVVGDAPVPPPPPPPPPPSCPDDMRLIPAGEFLMGSPDGVGGSDEHPQHRVRFAQPFCMERTEVSVAAYRACAAAGACEPAPTTVEWPGLNAADRRTYSQFCNGGHDDLLDHPINCVNWQQANAFCGWSGHTEGARRLPREAEWEYAAHGTGNGDGGAVRTWPWLGEVIDGVHANFCGDECGRLWRQRGHGITATTIPNWHDDYGATAPVTAFAAGATPDGLLNMAGNVWEWVDDVYAADAYAHHDGEGGYVRDASAPSQSTERRAFRGGGWSRSLASVARAAYRVGGVAASRSYELGFRCARGAR